MTGRPAGDPGFAAAAAPAVPVPAAPGFAAGGLPGGNPGARRPVFGSAGYPGGASGRHSMRVAASGFGETSEARANQARRAVALSATPGGSQAPESAGPAGGRLRHARRAGGLST
ncbi:hypothetical protein ACFCXH_18405, partial [Streptomyces nojiriensis]